MPKTDIYIKVWKLGMGYCLMFTSLWNQQQIFVVFISISVFQLIYAGKINTLEWIHYILVHLTRKSQIMVYCYDINKGLYKSYKKEGKCLWYIYNSNRVSILNKIGKNLQLFFCFDFQTLKSEVISFLNVQSTFPEMFVHHKFEGSHVFNI